MKNTREQILSFAENELVKKESIRRAVLNSVPDKQRKPVAWTKILLPIAACLVLAVGVVFTIPSARAEVLSWFHADRPEEYLTADPETRTLVPVLDELIVPPAKDPSESAENTDEVQEAPVPAENTIVSETNNRLLFVTDEDVWQQIADAFAVDIGESMYDGEKLYFSVSLHGLTALPDVVQYTGASITQTRVPQERLPEYFEDGLVPKEHADGTMTLWIASPGIYTLLLPNGLELPLGSAGLWYDPELVKLIDDLYAYYGDIDYTDDIREEINEKVLAWLNGRTVKGVVKYLAANGYGYMNGKLTTIRDLASYLTDLADENGILTGTLLYRTRRTEPDQVLLEAEIGTLRVDMLAYNRIPKQKITVESDAVLGTQTVVMSHSEWVDAPSGNHVGAVTNYELDLNGVSLHPYGNLFIDGLGIHDLHILLKMPKEWTEEQCHDFLDSLLFYTDVNGSRYGTEYQYANISDNTCKLTLRVPYMPYDVIDSLDTFSIVPYHLYRTAMRIGGETGKIIPLPLNEQVIEPETDENIDYPGATLKLENGTLTFQKQP
ncbi:MAG: hypothetical protein IKI52_01920 [Clostridia bacterium]|nr:hypothetical protein [Clostridia bacterium]